MSEQNVWRNYQTKLLGGGLLIVGLVVLASLLSHHKEQPGIGKKEMVIAIQPQQPITPQPTAPTTTMVTQQPVATAPKPAVIQTIEVKPANPQPTTNQTTTLPTPMVPHKPIVEVIKPLAAPAPKVGSQPAVNKTQAAVTKPQATVATKNSPYTKAEKHLLTVPKAHYTVQLLGASSAKNIQAFIKNNRLQEKATFFQTYNKGKSWYVIVYGNYKTKAEAQAALKKLPSAIRAQHPWVRSYGEIHAAIQRKLS